MTNFCQACGGAISLHFSTLPGCRCVNPPPPSQVKWDASAPLVMGEPVERMRISMTDGVRITPNQEPIEYTFTSPATEWARIDKDMNVTHLDMELCAKGPHNAYTALAMAIWNKAVQEEREKSLRLWMLLDDIDTADDIAKSDDKLYRQICQNHQKKRWDILSEAEVDAAIRARGNT